MVRVGGWRRGARVSVAATAILSTLLLAHPVHATPSQDALAARCSLVPTTNDPTVVAGRPANMLALAALNRDRARFANLGPLHGSQALTAVAERHSAYMLSIGSWSDGDPTGDVLSRVRATGLNATYAGQNVVTAHAGTIGDAIQQGEAFFAAEANGGGPHWDNLTNPNHHYVGTGLAVTGTSGNYTVYLTQVFADVGGCAAADTSFTTAAAIVPTLKPGTTAHSTVDVLQLRTEPNGQVIGTLSNHDRLRILTMQDGWAQVKVLTTNTFGWVFAGFLAS